MPLVMPPFITRSDGLSCMGRLCPSSGLRPPSPRTRGEGLSPRISRVPLIRPSATFSPHAGRKALTTHLSSAPHPAFGHFLPHAGRKALTTHLSSAPHPAFGHFLPARGAQGSH